MGVLCQLLLCTEEMAARPETSELSSVSKHIIDQECRERAKIRELTELIQVSTCVFERSPVFSFEKLDFWSIQC